MYRRHIRMTQLQASRAEGANKSRSIQHLAAYSGVYIAWNITARTYNALKTSNNFLNKSFSNVEKAALFLSDKSEPIFRKLEPQLKILDDLALMAIINMEQIVALIMRQPQNLITYVQRKYDEMIESGLRKYEEVKSTALTTAKDVSDVGKEQSSEFLSSPSGEFIVMALNSAFDAYEMYLDFLLPPLGDGFPELAFGDRARPPVLERADALTERFKERLYKHFLLYLQNLRLRGKLTVAKYQKKLVSAERAHA